MHKYVPYECAYTNNIQCATTMISGRLMDDEIVDLALGDQIAVRNHDEHLASSLCTT